MKKILPEGQDVHTKIYTGSALHISDIANLAGITVPLLKIYF